MAVAIRADGKEKVTGAGRYAADLTLTGLLHGRFKYAEIGHARVSSAEMVHQLGLHRGRQRHRLLRLPHLDDERWRGPVQTFVATPSPRTP